MVINSEQEINNLFKQILYLIEGEIPLDLNKLEGLDILILPKLKSIVKDNQLLKESHADLIQDLKKRTEIIAARDEEIRQLKLNHKKLNSYNHESVNNLRTMFTLFLILILIFCAYIYFSLKNTKLRPRNLVGHSHFTKNNTSLFIFGYPKS